MAEKVWVKEEVRKILRLSKINVHALHSNSEVSMSRYTAPYISENSQESFRKKKTFLAAADAGCV